MLDSASNKFVVFMRPFQSDIAKLERFDCAIFSCGDLVFSTSSFCNQKLKFENENWIRAEWPFAGMGEAGWKNS